MYEQVLLIFYLFRYQEFSDILKRDIKDYEFKIKQEEK